MLDVDYNTSSECDPTNSRARYVHIVRALGLYPETCEAADEIFIAEVTLRLGPILDSLGGHRANAGTAALFTRGFYPGLGLSF